MNSNFLNAKKTVLRLPLGLAIVLAAASLSPLFESAYAGNLDSELDLGNTLTGIIGGVPVANGNAVMTSTVLIVGSETAVGPNGQQGTQQFICTGSIIANDLVLTAAHCLGSSGNAVLQVAFRSSINGPGPIVGVIAQTRPQDYVSLANSSPVDQDDVGLLRLAQPIPAGYAPAHILTDLSVLQSGTPVLLAGYGIDVPVAPTDPKDPGGAGVLREVQQQILNPHYGNTEVLVSLANGRGACHGDSGGPAFIQSGGVLYLFGVTSRLTSDDPEIRNGNRVLVECSVDMVYTNLLTRGAWINSAAAQLEQFTPTNLGSGQPQPTQQQSGSRPSQIRR